MTLKTLYREAITYALNIHQNKELLERFNKNSKRYPDINDDESFYNIFTLHCEMLKGFGEIADRGIPIDSNRIQHLKDRASVIQTRLEDDLMRQYSSELFKMDKNGKRSMCMMTVQELLKKDLKPAQLET